MHRLSIPKNANGGRDFVVGDMHGTFDRLTQFLEYIKFDPIKDRMFSVGDLVDRGPMNEQCLALLYEPWFFAVKANHEQMMCEYFSAEYYGYFWHVNGGAWGLHYKKEQSDIAMEIRHLVDKANELPLMMTVEKQDGTFFHVIHAELFSLEPLSDKKLNDEETFNNVAFLQSTDGDYILWGRRLFNDLYARKMTEPTIAAYKEYAVKYDFDRMFGPNLSHIYSGHTVVQQPTRYKGQTNIDTGAYGSYDERDPWRGLTFTEPATDRFWTVFKDRIEEVSPLVLG